MAVKIKGLRLFDTNCYDKITIIENEGNYNINIQCYQKTITGLYSLLLEKNTETKKIEHIPHCDFKNDNKGKTDEEKVISVVEKFLEYSTIDTLSHKWITYKSKYEIADGVRQLKICLFNPKLKVIPKMIVKKYLEDRLKFCTANSDANDISIGVLEHSSYYLKDDTIRLVLMKRENGIETLERNFFKEFISSKLNQVNGFVHFRHNVIIIDNKKYMLSPMYLTCGSSNIEIQGDMELYEIVSEIVKNHNNELEQSKMMQLKIKGFK